MEKINEPETKRFLVSLPLVTDFNNFEGTKNEELAYNKKINYLNVGEYANSTLGR